MLDSAAGLSVRARVSAGSGCGSDSGRHGVGVGAGGAVHCSPVGCDPTTGQHLPPLRAAACRSRSLRQAAHDVHTHVRWQLSKSKLLLH